MAIGLGQRKKRDYRNAAIPQQSLLDVLVHPDSRSEDTCADVRDACQLKQALDGAILTVGAVKHGEDQVEPSEGSVVGSSAANALPD